MSNKRYHINPDTGVPSICRAEAGNCPYGGDSGSDNHYNSYSEAQQYSQEVFEETYRLLPASIEQDSKEIMKQIESRRKVKMDMVEKLPKASEGEFKVTKAIIESEDENVVMGVIEGEIYDNNQWIYSSVALQNKNISKVFLNEALFDYPVEFDKTTRCWLTLNESLTHDELVSIIENEDEDIAVRSIAFRNVNIDKEYVSDIINNHTDRLEKLPYSMIVYSHNRDDKTKDIESDAMITGRRDNRGISMARRIAIGYVPWKILNRRNLEEDKS